MLGQFVAHHLGRFFHAVFDLFLAEQHHIIDPGNLDQDQSDQGKTDEHSYDSKDAFHGLSNRFVIYCIRFIFTPLATKSPAANVRCSRLATGIPGDYPSNLTSCLAFQPLNKIQQGLAGNDFYP
jgi:hypothetical protein